MRNVIKSFIVYGTDKLF